MRYSILLVFCLLGLLSFGQPTDKYQRIDSLFRSVYSNDAFSGVLVITEKGKLRYEQALGFRNIAAGIPLEQTDIFELASVSKQFTAMIIMMLAEQGRLQYDDAVERYLNIPYRGITIRHLLTHTSGLPDYQAIMDQYWDKTQVADNNDIITYLNRYAPPVRFVPGDRYEYSNTGYVLLASIAEKASGQDFTEMCRKWIFRRLKMKDTDLRFPALRATMKRFALGHIYVPERKVYVHADSFPSSNYTIWLGKREGPGRISATAKDLLKWDRALQAGKLVSAATMTEAYQPMKLNNGQYSNYGFGWMIEPETPQGKVVQHSGDNPGYKTQIIRYLDQDITIILLNNNAHAQFNQVLSGIRKILANAND